MPQPKRLAVQSTIVPNGYKEPVGDVNTFQPFIVWLRSIKRNSKDNIAKHRRHFNQSILTKEQKLILEDHG